MPEPAGPTGRTHWALVWHRWTRLPLRPTTLGIAAIALVVDFVTAGNGASLGSLGRVATSPALPLGLVLAAMIGPRRLGLDRTNLGAWREFLAVTGAALGLGVWQYAARVGGRAEAVGLVLDALDEELVYRLAVLVLVGALAAALLRRNWRNAEDWGLLPGVLAVVASGLVFTVLPGHVAQISDPAHALPFTALGMVLGYVVLRTGAIVPAVMTHALLNLATITTWAGGSVGGWRRRSPPAPSSPWCSACSSPPCGWGSSSRSGSSRPPWRAIR